MRLFTKEQHEFLVEHVEGRTTKELAEIMNNKFNLSVSKQQIHYYKKNHRLVSNISTAFNKGHIPKNKGTKGLYNSGGNKTSFKKGQKAHNYKPVGYERTDCYGYVLVKVNDEGPWHKRWRHKHKIVWEEANGPIPPNHVILFADQNKENIVAENLLLVSRKQLATLNKQDLLSNNAELTKTGIIMADLYQKISERTK
ncbi:HNH endonuclease [Terribacillus aidingensis]|uniref:HNH endonuclease n=2 Tax=Terribacillus aidingensis TaxID=586416 RepID=A0A285NZ84_9BACI|nr:HNH endonuclease [Terribacillus aidingensis]